MKKIIIILLLLSWVLPQAGFAQSATSKADKYFEKKQYQSAIKAYEKLLKKDKVPDPAKPGVYYKLGECYRIDLLDYPEAKKWYEKAYDAGYSDPKIYLRLGDVTLKAGEYEKAKPFIEKYLTYNPNDSVGLNKLKSVEFASRNMKKIPDYTIQNEKSLNTKNSEYSATYLPPNVVLREAVKESEKQYDKVPEFYYENNFYWAMINQTPKARLVFTSNREENKNRNVDFAVSDQIYEVTFDKKSGTWEEPVKLKGGVNTRINNNGIFSYNDENKIAYFQRCNSPTAKKRYCNIHYSIYDNNTNTWSESEKFQFSTDDYTIGHPNLSNDANTLFFASDKPGGYGGADLYMTQKDTSGEWSEPVNLGPKINTHFDETFPFIKGDSVLYFSSNGHIGMGGDDIFYSKVDVNWNFSKPVNMGYPINSTADDFAIIFTNPTDGFFCSNREIKEAVGSDDIYSFRKKPKAFMIKGNVKDQYNRKFDKLTVVLTGSDGTKFETTTDSLGNYVFDDEKLDPDVQYEVEVKHDDYLSEKNRVNTDEETMKDSVTGEADTVRVADNTNINVMEYNRGKETEIKNIYWDFDKWNLRASSERELDILASILNGDPSNYIIINSYADEQGTFQYNKLLSHKRAKAVVNYLIAKGVDKNRIIGRGYGESQPVVKRAATPTEHQKNRRTTFEVKTRDEFIEYLSYAGVYGHGSKKYSRYLTYYGDLAANVDFGSANDIEFRVQFIATREPIEPGFYRKIERNIPNEPINSSHDPDGYYRYSIGKYIDIDEAYKTRNKLKSLGYNTYIVAFNNGRKISVKLAQKLLNESLHGANN